MVNKKAKTSVVRGSPVLGGQDQSGTLSRLIELNKATTAFRNAAASLGESSELQTFLERMLTEALYAAGTGSGAAVIIEGDLGNEVAHHLVILIRGRTLSVLEKRARGLERVPFNEPLRAFANHVEAQEDGVFSVPEDPLYPPDFRDFLIEHEFRSVCSTALRIGGRMIGWFGVGFYDDHPRNADELTLHRLLADQMAVAIEVTRIAEDSKQTAVERERAAIVKERLAQLSKTNEALSSTIGLLVDDPSLDTVLGHVLQNICEQFESCTLGAVWLIDSQRRKQHRLLGYRDGKVLSAVQTHGESPPEAIHPKLFPPDGQVPQPFMLDLDEIPEDKHALMKECNTDRALILPMYILNEPIGAFTIGLNRNLPDPSSESSQTAQTLAQQAAIAVQLMRLAKDNERAVVARERELAARQRVDELAKTNRALLRSLDVVSEGQHIDHTLGQMLRVMADQVGCASAKLCLRIDDSETFRVEHCYSHGAAKREAPPLLIPAFNSLWRTLIASREPFLVQQTKSKASGKDIDTLLEALGMQTLIGVPLILCRRVIGCFTFAFAERRTLISEQFELLQMLAHQATLAIQLERIATIARDESRQAATLAERSRIARDLHDGLAQGLTGILMRLHASLRSVDPQETRKHIAAALDSARGALVDARRSVHALRKITDEQIPFASAMKGVLRTMFAGSPVATDIYDEVDNKAWVWTEQIENELLRIAQEVATNTLKHAQASRFDVQIKIVEGRLQLIFQDDGIGFSVDASIDGFGLTGIRERAQSIHAALEVISEPGRGTCISVTLASSDHIELEITPMT